MNKLFKIFFSYLISLVTFLLLTIVYFSPEVFEGKLISQFDNTQARGMTMEIKDYKERSGGLKPLWTNSAFSGMPTFQLDARTRGNIAMWPNKLFLLGNRITSNYSMAFGLMLGGFLLLIMAKLDWKIAVLGGIAFGLSANHIILMEAGHSTKLWTLVYVGPTIGAALMAFRGKYLLGGSLFAFFLNMQIEAVHIQITFYTFLILFILGVVELIYAFQEKNAFHLTKAIGILILGTLLGVLPSSSKLWTTYEFSKETIRGKSELTKTDDKKAQKSNNGLTKEYAFGWSYGKLETFNLLIPNFVGGTSAENFVSDRSSSTFKALRKIGNQEKVQQFLRQTGHYWGTQPMTSGPVYMGTVVCLLFFLGAFLVKGRMKWWLVSATILTIFLAWGKNFALFNYFLFDYIPLFNKFRAVSMALSLTLIIMILLGAFGLETLWKGNLSKKEKEKGILKAVGITTGLCVLGLILSFGFNYGTEGLPNNLATALADDRASLLRKDVIRSLFFIALSGTALWVYIKGYLKKGWALVGILTLITLIDIWGVDRRFINSDSFKEKRKIQTTVQAIPANKEIMRDKDLHYRVLDLVSGNPFSNAIASYHHKSVGGYNAAKLMIYQELIERYLSNPAANMHIYGMLNTKYIIQGREQVARNPKALGNAWFVNDYELVADADAEMAALSNLNPAKKAVIQKRFAPYLEDLEINNSATSSIKLTGYEPDKLSYEYNTTSEQLAVLSEVYYNKGWNVYIDGKLTNISCIKANYVLRALRLPAGKHTLVLKFEPSSFYDGVKFNYFGTIAMLCFLALGIFFEYRKQHYTIN